MTADTVFTVFQALSQQEQARLMKLIHKSRITMQPEATHVATDTVWSVAECMETVLPILRARKKINTTGKADKSAVQEQGYPLLASGN